MNKGIISIIAAVILLISSIISGAIFFGCAKSPDGLGAMQSIIDGCNKKSESQIMKNFDEMYEKIYFSKPDFSKCVTSDDYLKVLGASFDYMYDEDCKTEQFRIIGTKEEELTDDVLDGFNRYLGEYAGDKKPSVFYAYLAADYKDADGVSHTAMNTLGVVALNGKVLGFVHLG